MKLPKSLNLHVEGHLSVSDAIRQKRTADVILSRLVCQPGIILGDEVGMGKTFVALAVASANVVQDPTRPVVIMVPRSVVSKWARDSETFRVACLNSAEDRRVFRVKIAETGVDFLKLLDDPIETRATVIILAHGALNRRLADRWVKLAILQAAIKRRHGAAELRNRIARFAPMILDGSNRVGERYELYIQLLETTPDQWKKILVSAHRLDEADDDPVPDHFLKAMDSVDLTEVLERVVDVIPERTSAKLEERIREAKKVLDNADGGVLPKIWQSTLNHMKISLPLLILDEAHRVRHSSSQLAQLFVESSEDLDNEAKLSGCFERMLFLTATPFQLGHGELRNVLSRFEAISWRSIRAPIMDQHEFRRAIEALVEKLDVMQTTTDRLEKAWKRMLPSDLIEARADYGEDWWFKAVQGDDGDCLSIKNSHIRSVMLAFKDSLSEIESAQKHLRKWVLRNTRSRFLPEPHQYVRRRERFEGAGVLNTQNEEGRVAGGLRVSPENALPFLLAARLSTIPECPRLFSEGIASSYEALLDTHQEDAMNQGGVNVLIDKQALRGQWYVERLRLVVSELKAKGNDVHPKIKATVDLTMQLWRSGAKILIFCHFRQTGAALHQYLSRAMLHEVELLASKEIKCDQKSVSDELGRIASHLDRGRPAARKVIDIVNEMLDQYDSLRDADFRKSFQEIILRFLRTPTFLVRYADLTGSLKADEWVVKMFNKRDASGERLADVIQKFLEFLSSRVSDSDRTAYLEALQRIQTGSHAGADVDQSFTDDEVQVGARHRLVGNVRRVYGETAHDTRERIMLAFNTPFYPEILIASSVMEEGVDLHLNCRHLIHHDLDWNPSSLEQRIGRIDRLSSKAERSGRPIQIYFPYLEGCQDEKQFRVVMDRERWFGVVMGVEDSMSRILELSAWEIERMSNQAPIPAALVEKLRLRLAI